MRAWTVVCAAALLAGCTGRETPPKTAWSDDGKPMTIVEFVDDTSWPFEVAEVQIVLDGETIVDHESPVGANTSWGFEVPFESLPEIRFPAPGAAAPMRCAPLSGRTITPSKRLPRSTVPVTSVPM